MRLIVALNNFVEASKNWLKEVGGYNTKSFCVFCKISLTVTVCYIECHNITTEHQKAAEPLSCNSKQKLLFIAMANGSTDLVFSSKRKAAWLFPAERCTFRTADHLSELCKVCSGEGQTGEKSETQEK